MFGLLALVFSLYYIEPLIYFGGYSRKIKSELVPNKNYQASREKLRTSALTISRTGYSMLDRMHMSISTTSYMLINSGVVGSEMYLNSAASFFFRSGPDDFHVVRELYTADPKRS